MAKCMTFLAIICPFYSEKFSQGRYSTYDKELMILLFRSDYVRFLWISTGHKDYVAHYIPLAIPGYFVSITHKNKWGWS